MAALVYSSNPRLEEARRIEDGRSVDAWSLLLRVIGLANGMMGRQSIKDEGLGVEKLGH